MRKLLEAIALAVALAFAFPTVALAKETPSKASQAKAKKAEKLDINTATQDQLKELPGIGDAYAKKIVEGRPYKAKDELWQRKIIPKSTYDKIKGQVIAHQSK
jgi:DNA uptake protein ComE-like DNA-binding protein